MSTSARLLLAAALAPVVALVIPSEARACGACFVPSQTRSTQVSSHRMVLSVSQDQTTLWDQIEYVGDPSEFAWVLPIHAPVEVGVSSDLLFTLLENVTRPRVHSPEIFCAPGGSGAGPGPSGWGGSCSKAYAASTGGTGGGEVVQEEEAVMVLQQSVVGPYETVQLSATDPMALRNWLAGHGYNVPAEADPTIDAYVAEGFDFLAIRLVPGESVKAMQPIRVTVPGASLGLPLRMVSIGTGAFTPITLWVVGEGRYETTSMPTFLIDDSQLVWDFDKSLSNYGTLREQGTAQNAGATWLVASALNVPKAAFDAVVTLTADDPAGSGYGGADPAALAQADEDALLAGIPTGTAPFVTRLFANLPKAALGADLTLGASVDQSLVPQDHLVAHDKYVGDPCPGLVPQPDCYTGPGAGSGGSGGWGGGASMEGGGCAVDPGGQASSALGWGAAASGLVAAMVLGARRRRARVAQRPTR